MIFISITAKKKTRRINIDSFLQVFKDEVIWFKQYINKQGGTDQSFRCCAVKLGRFRIRLGGEDTRPKWRFETDVKSNKNHGDKTAKAGDGRGFTS